MPRFKTIARTLLAGFFLVFSANGFAAQPPVEIVALFKDRAMVRTGTGQVMLRVGQPKDGYQLISSDANRAVIEYKGERFELLLSGRVGGQFTPPEQKRLAISSDQLGQYRVQGAINNQMVGFLVDTGASAVVMSEQQAQALRLDYLDGQQGTVITAQGQVPAYFFDLDVVNVGGLSANNVGAAVIRGNYPIEVLLGMTFLKDMRIEEADGLMTIIQSY